MNDYKSSKSWDILKKALIKQSEVRGFQTKLAKALDIQPQAVQRYFDENDKTIPGMDRADQMADTIGTPLWKILKPDDAEESSPVLVSDQDRLRDILRILPTLNNTGLEAVLRLAVKLVPGTSDKVTGSVKNS